MTIDTNSRLTKMSPFTGGPHQTGGRKPPLSGEAIHIRGDVAEGEVPADPLPEGDREGPHRVLHVWSGYRLRRFLEGMSKRESFLTSRAPRRLTFRRQWGINTAKGSATIFFQERRRARMRQCGFT